MVDRVIDNCGLPFREEVRRRLEILLPDWKKLTEAQPLCERRRAYKATFNAIRRALHPDSRQSSSDKKLGGIRRLHGVGKIRSHREGFPTNFTYPDGSEIRNLTEWDKRRAAARKAKRTPAERQFAHVRAAGRSAGKGPGNMCMNRGLPRPCCTTERVSLGRTQPDKSPLGAPVPIRPLMVLRS